MKSCPICSETYSERIDFCFNDGGVLQLLPSALDAPVPRRMTARESATADRLRTGTTQEIRFEPTPEPAPVPVPASASEAPTPTRVPIESEAPPPEEDPTQLDLTAVRVAAAMSAPAPQSSAGASPGAPPPVFDELPKEVGAPPEPRGVPAWLWFAGAAAAAGAVVVFMWAVSTPPAAPKPVAAPAPVAAVAAPPPVAPVEPVAAPAPVEAVATAAPPEPAPAPSRSPAAGKGTEPAPPTPKASDKSAVKATIRRPDAAIAAPAGPSPWDAPAAAAESVVSVTSDPSGAVVRIDGRLRGKTPLDARVPFGRHEVELSLEGYALVQRSVDVRSPTLKLPNQLEVVSREGSVQVQVPDDWAGAMLVVDGRPRGKVPATIRLPEGAHRFELRRGDFSAIDERIVRFEASGTARLMLDPR